LLHNRFMFMALSFCFTLTDTFVVYLQVKTIQQGVCHFFME